VGEMYLITRETAEFTVRDSPHAVVGDTGGHVPMFSIDDEVGVNVIPLLKRIVDLQQLDSR
jgi:hypothetical protein